MSQVEWKRPVINVYDFHFKWWVILLWRLRHPILWWKYRCRVYRGLPAQEGLSDWKPIDPKRAGPEICSSSPESFVLRDPTPARYNSLDDALADMREGTRKRAIRPFEKIGGRIFQRQEYRDAPIGVGIVMGEDPCQIAYEVPKSPSDRETGKEEIK